MLEKKLYEELNRFKNINKYVNKLMVEQELPAEPAAPADPAAIPPPAGDVPAPPPGGEAPAAEPMGEDTEEIDITDLVNMTKNIKKDIDKTQTDHTTVLGKMDDVFTKLTDLEQKLSEMDAVMSKIDQLNSKIETIKEPTPVEKLEMRSLDSYPFNQKPNDFFSEKQQQMKLSGKNEYVLTKDDVENYSKDTIRDTFNPNTQEDEFRF